MSIGLHTWPLHGRSTVGWEYQIYHRQSTKAGEKQTVNIRFNYQSFHSYSIGLYITSLHIPTNKNFIHIEIPLPLPLLFSFSFFVVFCYVMLYISSHHIISYRITSYYFVPFSWTRRYQWCTWILSDTEKSQNQAFTAVRCTRFSQEEEPSLLRGILRIS